MYTECDYMNDDNKFIDFQEETIYTCNQIESDDEIDKKIANFFSILVNRRRNDPIEGGLQACTVIFPEKSAMKVCEMDGTAPHDNAFINLVKHMNGDYRYISLKGTEFPMICKVERRQLSESGIQIRILDGKNELMLAITSNLKSLSQYQTKMLNRVLLFCKMLKDNQTYARVIVGFHISEFEIEFEDLTSDHYNNILNSINGLQKRSSNIARVY